MEGYSREILSYAFVCVCVYVFVLVCVQHCSVGIFGRVRPAPKGNFPVPVCRPKLSPVGRG